MKLQVAPQTSGPIAGNRVIRGSEGVIQAGKGVIRAGQEFKCHFSFNLF